MSQPIIKTKVTWRAVNEPAIDPVLVRRYPEQYIIYLGPAVQEPAIDPVLVRRYPEQYII